MEEKIRAPGARAAPPSLHQPSRQPVPCGSCSDPPHRTWLRRAPAVLAERGRKMAPWAAGGEGGQPRPRRPWVRPLLTALAARCPPPPHRTAGGTRAGLRAALQSADGARSALTYRPQTGKADLLFAFHLYTVLSCAWLHSSHPFLRGFRRLPEPPLECGDCHCSISYGRLLGVRTVLP